MPSKEAIERFTEVLNSLGSEPEVRAEKGEKIEQIAPPEEGLPPDISELLGTLGGEEEPAPSPQTLEEPAFPEPGEEPAAGAETPSSEEAAGIDFGSLFADEAEAGAFEDLEATSPVKPEPTPSRESPEVSETDMERMDTLSEDFGPLDELPEPAAEGEAVGSPPPAQPDAEGFEPSTEEPFSPEMEAFGPGGIESTSEEPPSLEPPSFEPSALEPPSLEENAPAAEAESPPESIELPSFDEMAIPEMEEGAEPMPAPGPSGPTDEEISMPEGFGIEETAPPLSAAGAEAEESSLEGLTEEASTEEMGLDEFTLPESVEEFGITQKPAVEERPTRPAREAPRPAEREEGIEELGAAEVSIEITDEQFGRMKRCLDSLPRNLKIAVQDIISSSAPSAGLKKLVDLLVSGASPLEIATLTGQMTGKRIRLPAGFEKRTGIAFEAERQTFGYALRENILPVLRVFLLTAIGLALFIFLGYRYVYRPMYAYTNYRTGYDHLVDNRFELANQSFSRATSVWPMKNWFYRYAEGFEEKEQFIPAEGKYEDLLRRWPLDKKGILDYARMMSTRLLDYKKADDLLTRILDVRLYDYDALLASGDNEMEWAAEDPARYEDARLSYATLIGNYGQKDDLLFRMLRYFIRTDNYQEMERLRAYYASRKDVKVDPAVFAELGGYLVDKRSLDYVQDVLFRAMAVKADLPEIHYNLARYYGILNDSGEEKKALLAALSYMKPSDPLTVKRITMEVDSHTRMGELYYKNGEYINAEKEYRTAIGQVEIDQKRKLLGTDAILGLPYRDLGDLSYYVGGDLDAALAEYEKAMENGFASTDLDYKMGYIHYVKGDYKASLDGFAKAAEGMSPARIPINLLYASGNAFYQRSDYFTAQGYYLRLMSILNDKRAGIQNFQPQRLPEHRALSENMLKVNNNLGVALYQLSQRMGDRRKRSEALAYLATATEQYDILSQDPESLRRAETRDLPTLNMRGILNPSARFDPQIYALIPKDMEAVTF
jgi:tetratricopeptide (TPR) repeat protein